MSTIINVICSDYCPFLSIAQLNAHALDEFNLAHDDVVK